MDHFLDNLVDGRDDLELGGEFLKIIVGGTAPGNFDIYVLYFQWGCLLL